MQGNYCCYCESALTTQNRHIEHFYHKGKKAGSAPYKHLTFSWDNLFGSCGLNSGDTCGHYKDMEGVNGPGSYNPNDIIKPDVEAPSDYLEFLPSGVICAKSGLLPDDERKAKETLRVLNLAALNGARKGVIDIFKKELDVLSQLDVPANALEAKVIELKEKVKNTEFQTAILSALF